MASWSACRSLRPSFSAIANGRRTATSRTSSRGLSTLLYADKGVAIVNKPSGLVCQLNHQHNSGVDASGGELQDLLFDVQYHLKLGKDSIPTPVHRLDKSTTGALVLALNKGVARDVSQQLKSRSVDKTYLAIVRGGSKTFPSQTGTISNTLIIDTEGRVSYPTAEEKTGEFKEKAAVTDWEVLATSPTVPLSLLKLTLHTGIKHQLRIHMARTLSAPILGDTLFSASRLPPAITNIVSVPPGYMYLHASQLSLFRYAPGGKRLRVSVVAPLPGYFIRLCAKADIPLSKDQVKGGVWIDGERIGNAGYVADR
ncbi:pseudouridine synthase [Cristinia sonorae]|uniref:Pseudouridine synthase n=1 Tax=Cristinia sonorae TaxID=1940300 RepID=A0A8K0UT05_9AGAR|nr:pseudouridine synthase [Cristinia sonorae]